MEGGGKSYDSLQIMQHQALTVVEADPEVPLLPVHMVAIHMEAGPLGLHHIQGTEARTHTNLVLAVLMHEIAVEHGDLGHLQADSAKVDALNG